MSEGLFTTIGDEPVEARIVAWVLGEASAFEAAELERLCGERPELMIFKRRMLALHGLLAEAENPQADESWKLPPEKRRAVEKILGEEQAIRLEVVKEKRIRRTGRRAFLAIAACVLFTLVITRLQPWKQTSEAIIEVRPRTVGMSPLGTEMGESSGLDRMTPQFFGTEFEKIKSRNSLEKVVENLDLANRWDMDKEQAVEKLKKSIKTENVRGTDLIKIQVRNSDKNAADEITREVAFAYKDYREQIEKQDADRQLAELNKAVRDQEDKVEERRKVLSTIVRTKGQLGENDSREAAIKRGLDAQDYADAKREFETDQQLLQTMKLKQIGETVARKAPSDSVVLHEVPGSGAKSAERSSDALASYAPARTQRLETTLPKELIEGTPRPIHVPNLEAPADGPAGSGTWSMAARSNSESKRAAREVHVGGQVHAPGSVPFKDELTVGEAVDSAGGVTAFGTNKRARVIRDGNAESYDLSSEEARNLRLQPGDTVELPQKRPWEVAGDPAPEKPSAPAASVAKVIAANTASANAVPVPEVDVTTPSLDFGNADDFGTGWGDGKDREKLVGGVDIVGGAKIELQSGLRSGDGAVSRNNIDAILNQPGRPGEGGAAGEKMISAAEEMPVLGRLFAGKENAPRLASGIVTEEVRYKIDDADRLPVPSEQPATAADETDHDYWDTTKAVAKSKTTGTEYEIHTGYKSEYLFRGVDLGKDKDLIPDDANTLAKAIREQEDKVEERRKVLATIVRNKGIIYKGQDSFYSQSGVDEDQGARSALQAYHEIEQQKIQLESQINSLLKYDSDQLMVYAGGLNLPDNAARQLYPEYLEAKKQLDADKIKGLGDNHPSVKAKVAQTQDLKRQLDESVVNLRATLQAQLDLATRRLKTVEAMKEQTREEAIKRGLDAQDFVDAKKEFEKDQELLRQMKLKLIAANMTAKPDLTQLMEEIAASDEPYSTFSLNISDASFRIAQAAMDKGDRPDPAGIKVEQFYNAVDYGDPAPAAGEPVSCEIEQAAHPVIPGRNLVRVALKTAAAGRSATQPLRLTLLVDQSGSMTRADRRAAMDTAMASLGKLLTENDIINIVGFSRTSRLVADGMKGDEAGNKLAELVNQSASEGGTNLETAIDLAAQMAQRRMLAGAQNRIVLFTDGAANLGDADPQRLAAKVEQLRQQGVAFDIAGIAADGLNDELLGELARKGNGRYYVVGKGAKEDFAKQLAGAFRPAAENVKVQVRFNPERVTRYKLIGFEKDRLKTEDFRNDKVDAAELAAEEAGVAIYQIEPNLNGSGEIGEVSVRFRDTASGEMVERGWTIPHDSAAPAIDRATASMQLAMLSMFAAEKLKGGPLGEAIDFKQFAEAQANVKHFFGNDARVAEVLRMVEMLK